MEFNRDKARTALASLTGASGMLYQSKCKLYTNSVVLSPDTELADFTEATFEGYAASAAMDWNTAYNEADGTASASADTLVFSCNAETEGESILGYYITNTAGDALLYAVEFDEAVPVNQIGDAVIVYPKVTLSFS